jgi:guanosine-3',5'-bis(diphosphate) 3'-pyrophosphohydrolase
LFSDDTYNDGHHLGQNLTADLENLLLNCRKNFQGSFDEDMVRKAFLWCTNTHKNQVRKSGDPYYTHPLNVAQIIAMEMPLDDISIAAALLHEITRHGGPYTLRDLHSEFGQTVAEIVEGVQKIHHVETYNIEELDNYRRLLLSLFKDVRIILIKLADRLHNMRTLDYLDPERQRKMSNETLEIYSPFAHRFGLGNIKWELEDLAFKHLNYDAYKRIREAIQLTRKEREEYLNKFILPVKEKLNNDPMIIALKTSYEIKGRPKHIYSIYNKTIIREKPLEELYDLFAVRIILDTDYDHLCFLVFGIISELYQMVPGTFKNYISSPKKNGYQSIHSAFFGSDGKPVEVQIRTRAMHLVSEKGVAAHFNYKPGFLPAGSVIQDDNIEEWLDQVRTIFETLGDEAPETLIENVRRTLLFDEIYVFTPLNELRSFPKDATALDFAFAIHTDIGQHCIGAKVNGRIVPLDCKLQSGDVIEILTSQNQLPSKDWLQFVVTQKSRNAIQKYLKETMKEDISKGEAIFLEILKKFNLDLNTTEIQTLLDHFHTGSIDELYIALNEEFLDSDHLISVISETFVLPKLSQNFTQGMHHEIENHKINLPIKMAPCCYPLPGDQIIGQIVPGTEIIVHRRMCNRSIEMISSKTFATMRLDWSKIDRKTFTAKIALKGADDNSINQNVTNIVLMMKNVQIQGFKFSNNNDEFTGYLTISFKNMPDYLDLFEKLKQIDGIKVVDRYVE